MLGGPGTAARPDLRCAHCGRAVVETQHSRTSYRVDYYSLHTGDVEPVTMVLDEDGPAVTFQKLVSTVNVITCADCYRLPAVREERDRRFRPERAEGEAG